MIFLEKILLTFKYLHIISSALGFIGTCIVFKYGVPNLIDTGGKISIVLEQEDENEKNIIKKYKKLSHFGLGMIATSFFIQLAINIFSI